MAVVRTDNRYYSEIADAIREKNGSADTYTPAQMAEAIRAISVGGIQLVSIAITTAPTKLEYEDSELFDPSGMTIVATYSNGATRTVTDYTYSPSGAMTSEVTAVTIECTEYGVTATATQAITVKKPITTVAVSVSGSTSSSYGYATIGSTKIVEATTMEIEKTQTVKVYVGAKETNARSYCYVSLNGTTVKSGYGTYTLDITGCKTVTIRFYTQTGARGQYYYCGIATA